MWSGCYDDLKNLARSRLRASGPLTLLDTTGLVNQSYLRLAEAGRKTLTVESRAQFFAYASRVMRSVIVDLARERLSERRGGGEVLRLDTEAGFALVHEDDPLHVENALTALAQREPRLAQVVEMRFFGGLTETEIAETLELSERTVRNDWVKARALMRLLLE